MQYKDTEFNELQSDFKLINTHIDEATKFDKNNVAKNADFVISEILKAIDEQKELVVFPESTFAFDLQKGFGGMYFELLKEISNEIMIIVGARVAAGGNSAEFVSVLAAFAVGAFRILPCLGRISISLNQVTNALPSINAVHHNIKEAEAYADKHHEMKFTKEQSYKLIDKKNKEVRNDNKNVKDKNVISSGIKFYSDVELRDITFSYSNKSGNVLEQINLTIEKGQTIAFIGTSGAGKTTLVDILLGLLTPSSGEILMDGTKITEIPELWSNVIGYVPQNIFISSATILENIAFGESINQIDENKVWEAVDKAELGTFIRDLPEGLMTKTGDRGVRLSGGQRQRIAIARALYHQPEILVLDEATSALDNETEAAVMSAIDSLQGQITMIIVAHRLTTVRNCDCLYEVGNKKIVKKNTKEVLRNAGILYD